MFYNKYIMTKSKVGAEPKKQRVNNIETVKGCMCLRQQPASVRSETVPVLFFCLNGAEMSFLVWMSP